jgi:hypothetical protein
LKKKNSNPNSYIPKVESIRCFSRANPNVFFDLTHKFKDANPDKVRIGHKSLKPFMIDIYQNKFNPAILKSVSLNVRVLKGNFDGE